MRHGPWAGPWAGQSCHHHEFGLPKVVVDPASDDDAEAAHPNQPVLQEPQLGVPLGRVLQHRRQKPRPAYPPPATYSSSGGGI